MLKKTMLPPLMLPPVSMVGKGVFGLCLSLLLPPINGVIK